MSELPQADTSHIDRATGYFVPLHEIRAKLRAFVTGRCEVLPRVRFVVSFCLFEAIPCNERDGFRRLSCHRVGRAPSRDKTTASIGNALGIPGREFLKNLGVNDLEFRHSPSRRFGLCMEGPNSDPSRNCADKNRYANGPTPSSYRPPIW